ncbi:MAG TPA: response regulator [Terriglobales bacterium]|nr:response regulator [Terriglobales bacterium]
MPEPPHILCVDDNEEGLEVRRLVLEAAGYSVQVATAGEQALALFAGRTFSAVVLDYSMPGMTGGEVAAEMRRLKPHVPIILLSGFTGQIPPDEIGRVDVFLVKGTSSTSLLRELKSRVPLRLEAERKPPRREELLAKAEKIASASTQLVRRARIYLLGRRHPRD